MTAAIALWLFFRVLRRAAWIFFFGFSINIHSHICSVAYPVLDATGEISAENVSESDPVTLAKPRLSQN
jgi:hypothetical protein